MMLPKLYLKRREERRVRSGHPWVFSNEVDAKRSPLAGFEPGDLTEIRSHAERFLGVAYVNPHALICARSIGRDPRLRFDRDLVWARLERALATRERLFESPFYRLSFAESDAMPGLVVDRYAGLLVAQLATAGLERRRELIIDALRELISPDAIVLRNDAGYRENEGLSLYVETAVGRLDEPVILEEGGARFRVWPTTGQKTGWYFDQRDNRARLARYAAGARVLDVFSYCGAWGIQAAVHGAEEVLCIDSSQGAVREIAENARLSGVATRVRAERSDAFDALKRLYVERRQFDVVVLDPPAFVRRRRDLDAGLEAYRRLNRIAMQLLADDGVLITASCSSHLHREQLRDVIRSAALKCDRAVQILEEGHQSADHPIHPAMPESEYLNVFVVKVSRH